MLCLCRINGGLTKSYLDFIAIMINNIDEDERNKVQVLWLDESHINRFALNLTFKLWHPGFCYPENWY